MSKRIKTHPGELLYHNYMVNNLTAIYKLSTSLCISKYELCSILDSKSPITDHIAEGLSKYFNTTKQFWLNAQENYDKSIEEVNA